MRSSSEPPRAPSRSLAARQRSRGHVRCGRSRLSGCGGLACCTTMLKATRKDRRRSRHSERSCRSWVGSTALTHGSTIGRGQPMPNRLRTYAAELVGHGPDVVLGAGGLIAAALQRASRTVPIVFVNVTDPVGGGLVASLARPGRNATGFTQFEFGISAKWLELLKQIAPGLTRVAVIRDPTARSGGGQLGAIQASAPAAFGVEVLPIDRQDAETIERGLMAFSADMKTGLIGHVEQTGTSPPATDRIAGGPQSFACDLRIPRLRCGGRIELLRA